MGKNSMTLVRKLTYLSTLVLIFALPWEDSISLPGIGSLARLMGVVAAGFWMATIVMEGKFRKPNLFHALVLFFFLWNFLSLFWSSDIESTTKRIKTYSQIFLVILIYWEVFQKPEELRAGLQAYVLGAYVLIVSIIYNYLSNNIAVKYEGRFSATGVNANDVALMLIFGLPIAIQLFLVAHKNSKRTALQWIDLLFIPLSIFSILLTGSRTSLIAIIPFIIFLVVTQKIKIERKILIFGLLLISLLALLPFIPSSIISRLGTIGDSISGADLGGRVNMWWKGIAVLTEHPILGVGSGAIDRTIGGAVHNTFITIVTETGFIGLILFLSILGLVIYQIIRLPRNKSELWLVILATWMIGILVLSWEFRKITWILLGFMIIESSFREQAGEYGENLGIPGTIGQSFKARKAALHLKLVKNETITAADS